MPPIATALKFLHRNDNISSLSFSNVNTVAPPRIDQQDNGSAPRSRFSADTVTTVRSPPLKQIARHFKRGDEHVEALRSPLRSARLGHKQSASQGSVQWAGTVKHEKSFGRGRQHSDQDPSGPAKPAVGVPENLRKRPKPPLFKPLLVCPPASFDVLNRSDASLLVKLDVGGTTFSTTAGTLTIGEAERTGKLGKFVKEVVEEARQKAKAQKELESVYQAFSRHTLLLSDDENEALPMPAARRVKPEKSMTSIPVLPTWTTMAPTKSDDFERLGPVTIETLSPSMTRLFQFPKPPLLVPSPQPDHRIKSLVPSLVSPREVPSSTQESPNFVKCTLSPTDVLSPAFVNRLTQTPTTAEPFDKALGPFFQALKLKQQREQQQKRPDAFPAKMHVKNRVENVVKRQTSVGSTQSARIHRKTSLSKRFQLALPPTGPQRRAQRRQARYRKLQIHVQQQRGLQSPKDELKDQVASSDCVPSLTSGSTCCSSPLAASDDQGISVREADSGDEPARTFTIFLDRDSTPYPAILSFLRDGHLPPTFKLFSSASSLDEISILLRMNPLIGFEMVADLTRIIHEAQWLGMTRLVTVCVEEQKNILSLLSRIEVGRQGASPLNQRDDDEQRRAIMRQRAEAGWI
ncbi:hypothetical protein OIV83_003115 [Microbotryomycetes sp. JL201]|nr:hypothetical protein OIV83_003115 [Microbotryomycetes sp. JL201]